jgi:signal transduction histidine kinase/serine/threonine protein kinase
MITANQTPVIPEYQITTQLYSGLRTLVYRAFRESDQKTVVIKLLTSEYPNFNELLQFRNQYTISKNLNIPGIIHPLSLEVNGNSYILVMEDNGGISLREYIKITTLSLVEFLSIAIQLTNILHDLHQNRVIHKDIKPANILIHPETKEVKLIDFSIASLLPKETQEIKNPNVLEGTLAYISPEQTGRMNRGIDYRSDFYSLGVTFYELLIGKLPFISDDPMELLHCHIAQLPTYVSEIKSEIPQVISEIINKLMAKNAENRYQSTLGLKRDLENCLCQLKDTGEVSYFEIGKQDLCDRFLIPEKLYGREVEVEELLAAFERVSQGNSEMMLVAGFSGIGKTAIVNEVHKPIAKQRGYFIKGKFDQFNRNIPFSAFVQAFRNLIGQLLTESDAQLSNWKNKILQALGDNAQVIIDVIPELEKIIGKEELSGNTAQNRFNILFHKFIHVFATKKHPLVIFMDDLQWADMASLKLIKLLISHTDTHYMLLIGAYRDNEVSSVHPLMLALQEIQQTQATINRITLVARNGEVAVFENLSNSITFAGDPYIINHKPKSVLCTPISQQGKLIGILYLENNLTVGAFTSDRLQIIQILTAQAAISLENAQLYRQLENYSHTLEKKVQQRTEELTEKANQLESTLTQLYSTQAQLIQSEKMSSLGQLVAGVAHEINNPVNFIHGNLTYVEEYTNKLLSLFNLYQESNIKQRKPQDLKYQELLNTVDLEFIEEDLPKILQSMKLGTERISQIVLSLRNFSHLDEAEWKSVDIHEGINSTLMILQHRLQEKADYPAIKVIKYYSKLPNIECYAGQLNQVFMSIFSNAIDAIEEKNSKETIEKIKTNNKQIIIRTSAIDGRCIKIAIADNGVGISSDIQQRIFDPFFTTKPVGSGTGLGLSISYGIIKKHGGQLTCNSKVGSGTEFMIEIPLKT